MFTWFRRRNPEPSRNTQRRRVRPVLQRLEGRVVPTTFTVLNANDSGPGSLRQAVVSANANGGADDIAFDPSFFNIANPRTINLFAASGQLTITQDLTINGPGPAIVTVSGGGAVRPFSVDDGNAVTTIIVTLRGMTVTGGNGTSNGIVAGDGGGIRTNENLTLDNMAVTGNTMMGNDDGGGVAVGGDGLLTVRNSTISGNTARFGGGIYFFQDGSLLMENSTVSGNIATSTQAGNGGGGIYFLGTVAAGGFTIRNSTLAGNTSAGSGGGLVLRAVTGTVRIQNSTITGNTANTTSTTAGYGGGGIALSFGTAASVLSIVSTIVSGNAATAANGRSDIAAIAAATVNVNFSAVGDADGFTPSGTSGNNLPFTAALGLGSLANNGGPTQTISFAGTSPLVNAGSNPASLAFDQRGPGFPRQVDTGVDIGAFESVFVAPTVSGGPFADVTAAGGATYAFDVTYSGATPINVSTLDNNDIRVTGPSGFNQLAQFINVTPAGNGSPRTATYRINAPGGTFGNEDNGTYTIRLEAGQVANTDGVTALAGTIGTFRVAVGQTFTVTNLNDSGAGSLRQAIQSANATDNVSDTIVFQPGLTGSITLNPTVGQLSITDGVTIVGPGVGVITVRGGGAVRVFNIDNASRVIDVTISGLSVTGGNGNSGGPTPVSGDGGGIRAGDERLTLDGMVVTGCVTSGANRGGGIDTYARAFLTIRNSTISGNTARRGGGIDFSQYGDGGLLIENSTVSGNFATDTLGTGGGGLYFFGAIAPGGFTIRNSTLAANTSAGSGGGIVISGLYGTGLIQNSTISGNTANTTSTAPGHGGGGIALSFGGAAAVLTIESSIVSGNTASAANGRSDIATIAAATVNVNFSAIGDTDGFTPSGTSGNNLPFGAALQLGTLGNNGGPTQTIPFASTSPLVNAGSNPANLTTDQRGTGFPRVDGSAADIGAFENSPLVVTNLNDSGPGSLRQALLIANASAGFAETITFQAGLTGTIPLASTLTITDGVTIAGPGAAALSVSGGNASRVFDIDNASAVIAVTIAGLTITGGSSSSSGGGIRVSNETLTLDRVVVTGNRTTGGAGGGGIAVYSTGSLTVRNCTISGNAAESISLLARGGGIFFLNGGTLLLENSTVSGNTAGSTRGGGGVYFYSPATGSSVTVRNSTIFGNSALSGGGVSLRGVPGSNPVLLIQNSTITGNTSATTSTTLGYGGGGIAVPANALFTPAITVVSSILSGNTATAANGRADLAMPNATPVNVNFSAIGDPDGFTQSGGNNLPVGTALGLGTLANNGGPTQTVAFAANSPLHNAGSNPANLTTDQRGPGFVRDSGGVDIGAFELQPPQVTGVAVNAGQTNTSQRSRVTTLTVTFTTQVTFAGAVGVAFQLSRIGGGAVGGFTATASVVGGVTVVTLFNFINAETRFGSLADGRFQVTVLANQVTAGGQQLDGDGNGTGGDNFVQNGSVANGLFSLYGDGNGDGIVNAADVGPFRSAFGTAVGNPLYRDFLDFDGDGFINAADFTQFRTRFGVTVP